MAEAPMAMDPCPDFIDSASPFEAREISVMAVLCVAAEASDSAVELSVEARLCLDAERLRKLTGREGAERPGLSETDLVEELDGPHKRPRNDVADFWTCCLDESFS